MIARSTFFQPYGEWHCLEKSGVRPCKIRPEIELLRNEMRPVVPLVTKAVRARPPVAPNQNDGSDGRRRQNKRREVIVTTKADRQRKSSSRLLMKQPVDEYGRARGRLTE